MSCVLFFRFLFIRGEYVAFIWFIRLLCSTLDVVDITLCAVPSFVCFAFQYLWYTQRFGSCGVFTIFPLYAGISFGLLRTVMCMFECVCGTCIVLYTIAVHIRENVQGL